MSATRRGVLMLTTIGVALLLAGGVALAAIIDGTNNADTIVGTANGDIIDGLGGNDTIFGMAGADDIQGGDGADNLFGGNRIQSIEADGGSNISGGIGDDYIIGSFGGDTLEGGPGADTILEGPWNDGAGEVIRGEGGDDIIQAASIPGHKDTLISCGPGVDAVEVDPLDEVSSDCETVRVFEPDADEGLDADDEPVEAFAPDVPANEVEEVPEDAQPPSGEFTVQSTRRDNFICSVPPRYAGTRWCESMKPVYSGDWVGVGIYSAAGSGRFLRFDSWVQANGERIKYLGTGVVNEYDDPFDYIYAGGKYFTHRTVAVHGRANVGTYWTRTSGYEYVWH